MCILADSRRPYWRCKSLPVLALADVCSFLRVRRGVTTDQKVKGSSPFGCASYERRKLKDPTLDTTWRKVVF